MTARQMAISISRTFEVNHDTGKVQSLLVAVVLVVFRDVRVGGRGNHPRHPGIGV